MQSHFAAYMKSGPFVDIEVWLVVSAELQGAGSGNWNFYSWCWCVEVGRCTLFSLSSLWQCNIKTDQCRLLFDAKWKSCREILSFGITTNPLDVIPQMELAYKLNICFSQPRSGPKLKPVRFVFILKSTGELCRSPINRRLYAST